MEKYIMALDQGTTSSRCILFDKSGNIVSIAKKEFRQYYPEPGYVEHDAVEIWDTQIEVAKRAMEDANITYENIAGIGITNQRETTVIWDRKTGRPVCNAIVWQCRRTADRINKINQDGLSDRITEKTGLVPDAYFSATKIEWILENVEGVRERAEKNELLFGTIDTWLIWNLTGGRLHITDYTNASRTMLFNINDLCWDKELTEYFNIPEQMLPKVVGSSEIYGKTDASVFGGEIPIAGVAGDQQAALFGQCCFEKGDVKNTYGTGCFLLMNTGEERILSSHGLITTLGAGTVENVPEYALEGSVFVAGAAVQWLRDELKLIENAGDTYEMACKVEDSAGGYVVPAFAGLGAPYWKPYCKGMIVGITRGFNRNHFVRATLEAIAYQTNDIIMAMKEETGNPLLKVRVDGGASANDFLMQFQADICDCEVIRPECIETTALGAAYLAGLAVGYWKDKEDIKENCKIDKTFSSDMGIEKREQLINGWKHAVETAISW